MKSEYAVVGTEIEEDGISSLAEARKFAEHYSREHPDILVQVYQLVGTVCTTTTLEWDE